MADEGGKRTVRMLAEDQLPLQGSASWRASPDNVAEHLHFALLSSPVSSQHFPPPAPWDVPSPALGADSADSSTLPQDSWDRVHRGALSGHHWPVGAPSRHVAACKLWNEGACRLLRRT